MEAAGFMGVFVQTLFAQCEHLVCTIHTMNSTDLIKLLERDGWT